MEKVKKFVEDFVEVEAKLSTLQHKTDLGPYNDFLDEYYNYFVKTLKGGMGYVRKEEWDEIDLMVIEDLDTRPPCNPRFFYKLSQYENDEYGTVWVAYVSRANPNLAHKALTAAFFIIEEGEKLAIAKLYLYSNFGTNGLPYRWEENEGHSNLTFDSLKGPVKIERYLEPDDMYDGLVHYHAEM